MEKRYLLDLIESLSHQYQELIGAEQENSPEQNYPKIISVKISQFNLKENQKYLFSHTLSLAEPNAWPKKISSVNSLQLSNIYFSPSKKFRAIFRTIQDMKAKRVLDIFNEDYLLRYLLLSDTL